MVSKMTTNFETTDLNFGDKSITENVEFVFDALDPSIIEHVRAGCGCTEAYLNNGAVRGFVSLEAATTSMELGETQSIIKTVTVYYRDGAELKVKEGMKQVFNTNKKQETLYIRGLVRNDKEVTT